MIDIGTTAFQIQTMIDKYIYMCVCVCNIYICVCVCVCNSVMYTNTNSNVHMLSYFSKPIIYDNPTIWIKQ